MSEKLEIVELDLGIDKVIKKATKAQQELEKLRVETNGLKKAQRESIKAVAKYKNELANLEKQGEGNSKKAKVYARAIAIQEKRINNTAKSLTGLSAQMKNVQKDYNTNTRIIQTYTDKKQKELRGYTEQGASIEQLGAILSENRKRYERLSEAERNNKDIGGKLLTTIQEQDKKYKELKESIGQAQANVGNYKDAMRDVLSQMTPFNQVLGVAKISLNLITSSFRAVKGSVEQAMISMKLMKEAQDSSTKSTLFLRGAMVLLGSTPLLIVLTAIVVAITSVVAWFKKTQAGADALGQAMAGISAVINVFIDRIAKVGGIIVGLITGQKSLSDAWNEGKKAVSGVSDEMEREYKIAKKLEKKLQQLEKAEILLDIKRSASKSKMKELNKISEDTTKSDKERIQALEQMKKMETELATEQKKFAEDRLANALGEIELTDQGRKTIESFKNGTISANDAIASLGISESTIEDLKKFRDLFVDLENKNAEISEIATTSQNKLNTIRQQSQAKRKKAYDDRKKSQQDAIKKQERLLQLYILTSKKDKSSLEEKLKVAKDVYKKELALIEQKKKAGLSATEVQIEQEKARQKYIETQTSLALQNATKELEIYTTKNAHILDSETKLNADLLAKQKAFLDERARLQIEALQKEQLSAEEFEAKKAQIEQDRDNAKREKDNAYTEQKRADRQKDFEDKQALQKLDDEIEIQNLINKNASEFEIQQTKLEQDTEQKLTAVENEKTLLDAKAEEDFQNKLITQEQRDNILLQNKQVYEGKKTLIEKQQADGSKKIEEAKFQSKVDLANQALGALSSVLDKESEAGKAVAVAQALINVAQGVTKAIAQGGVMGIVTGAVVAAAGAVSIGKILSTKPAKTTPTKAPLPKASKGITLKGNSHANGGVGLYDANGNQVVEAEGGENVYAITNKKASSLINNRGLLGALSYINERTGGIPLTKNVSFARAGGLVSSNLKTSTNVNKIVDAFEQRENTLQVINVAEHTVNVANQGVIVKNKGIM